jgi:hypothetical protein
MQGEGRDIYRILVGRTEGKKKGRKYLWFRFLLQKLNEDTLSALV